MWKRWKLIFFNKRKNVDSHFTEEDIQIAHKDMKKYSPSVVIKEMQIKS